MKDNLTNVLFAALLAISFVTQVQANPWLWPGKTPVKTLQLAVPANNGGVISVTVPSKATSPARRGTVRARDQVSTADQHEDERIAADLERHF